MTSRLNGSKSDIFSLLCDVIDHGSEKIEDADE
jgi:hypothetical protein